MLIYQRAPCYLKRPHDIPPKERIFFRRGCHANGKRGEGNSAGPVLGVSLIDGNEGFPESNIAPEKLMVGMKCP